MYAISHSVALFHLAGFCEIGDGYWVWQWWRNGTHWVVGLAGATLLCLYGIVPRPISRLTLDAYMPRTAVGLWFCQSPGGGAWIISSLTATTL